MTRQQHPGESLSRDSGNRRQSGADDTRGKLSVREAGRKGGQRVRELIQRGRMVEQREKEQQERR